MKPHNFQPSKKAIFINEAVLTHGIIFKNKDLLNNINNWHKFTVYNTEDSTREEILESILEHVFPLDLIPVYFRREENACTFLARNCGQAIQKICNDNLVIPALNKKLPYKLNIIIRFATTGEFKIDVQKNIMKVLTKRYNLASKTLDLTNLCKDSDLTEYCPLSQPKIMFFVLHLSKSLSPLPETYLLSNNRIKTLNPMEALHSLVHVIKKIDLRNNLLSRFTDLQNLDPFQLTDLHLDGNPFCNNISAFDYIKEVTKHIKNITNLDGQPLSTCNFPTSKKIFLCNIEGLDLVNQFLEHYFYLYDSQNRHLIKEMYHKNALFSLNSVYHNSQLSSPTTRLFKYNNISRNLHKIANLANCFKNIFKGNIEVANILTSLPATEHDTTSFLVDLMYYTSTCAIIGVSGIFRERPETLLGTDKLFGFRRIFTLELLKTDGICFITNEEFHVHNAFTWQSLCFADTIRPLQPITYPSVPTSFKEHEKVVDTLKIITTLNSDWAKKCLEECHYDLKKALCLFVDLYKQNRIPKEGFLN